MQGFNTQTSSHDLKHWGFVTKLPLLYMWRSPPGIYCVPSPDPV